MEIGNRTIALLIDSENISYKYLEILLEELNKFGTVTYKRIYGDFTTSDRVGWKKVLNTYGINPIQQFSVVSGKNSTDSAMIIDAMDILYKGKVDCICLATSDSDFTRLATRFKEENYFVIGAGEDVKTPVSFRNVCDRFLLMDLLLKASKAEARAKAEEKIEPKVEEKTKGKPKVKEKIEEQSKKKPNLKVKEGSKEPSVEPKAEVREEIADAASSSTDINVLIANVKKIIADISDDDGLAYFAAVINLLYRIDNAFNPINYGVNKKPVNFFKELPGSPFVFSYDAKKALMIKTRE